MNKVVVDRPASAAAAERVCVGRVKGDQKASIAITLSNTVLSLSQQFRSAHSSRFGAVHLLQPGQKIRGAYAGSAAGGNSAVRFTRFRRVISISSPDSSKLSTAGNLYRRSRSVARFM